MCKKSYFIECIKNWYIFRPNIYLDIRESKQNHETDLQWMVDYLSAEKTNAKKIIVYCRYKFSYIYLYIYNDGVGKPLDLAQCKFRRPPPPFFFRITVNIRHGICLIKFDPSFFISLIFLYVNFII